MSGDRPQSWEFYVDFETVSNVNDDFSKIPEQNGQNLISMIGCGHMQDGKWVFQCFIVERLDEVSEAEAIDKWLAHMAAVSRSLGRGGATPNHPLVLR